MEGCFIRNKESFVLLFLLVQITVVIVGSRVGRAVDVSSLFFCLLGVGALLYAVFIPTIRKLVSIEIRVVGDILDRRQELKLSRSAPPDNAAFFVWLVLGGSPASDSAYVR